ncbi:hypothetical protein AAFF_G00098660, partial [Aldrovandia affinis]
HTDRERERGPSRKRNRERETSFETLKDNFVIPKTKQTLTKTKMSAAKPNHIRGLSGQKETQAEEAKQAAVEILKDAEAKGMYGFPVSFYYTCAKPVDPHSFCCIPTQTFLKNLLETMQKVVFKEDEDPENSNAFAYVCPNDKTCTVYLCKAFWDAPDHLQMDSKPGTLIHEVSHLLGTDDITYDILKVVLYEDYGTLMGWSGPMSEKSLEKGDILKR